MARGLVDLLRSPTRPSCPAAIAEALGLVHRSGSLIDKIAAFLEAHELLLVLDNCEHLIAAGAQLVDKGVSGAA